MTLIFIKNKTFIIINFYRKSLIYLYKIGNKKENSALLEKIKIFKLKN